MLIWRCESRRKRVLDCGREARDVTGRSDRVLWYKHPVIARIYTLWGRRRAGG